MSQSLQKQPLRMVNVKLPPEIVSKIDAAAAVEQVTRSDWIRVRLGVAVTSPEPRIPELHLSEETVQMIDLAVAADDYDSAPQWILDMLEAAVHRSLYAARRNGEAADDVQMPTGDQRRAALLSAQAHNPILLGVARVPRFELKSTRCRHPMERREVRGDFAYCGACGSPIRTGSPIPDQRLG